jgi:hypothetical protein
MSEEQRAAAVERLAKAREARGHDGSASVHPDLLNIPEDSPVHWKKVRQWVKEITQELNAKKALRLSKESKDRLEYQTLEVYLGNLKRYLDTGVWLDHRYGRHREGKTNTIVTTIAYHADGRPKRTVGHFYRDIGEYTQEMKEYDDRVYGSDGRIFRAEFHEQEEILEDGGEDSTF